MKAVLIAGTNLRRLFRERANIFFVIVLPMLLILLLGAAFGGSAEARVGVVGVGEVADEVRAAIARADEVEVETRADERALVGDVERGGLQAGIVVPDDAGRALQSGETVTLRYLARPDDRGAQVRTTILAAAAEVGARHRAARLAGADSPVAYERAIALAAAVAPAVPPVSVRAETAGEALFPEDLGRFDLGASQQLLLFVFLTSLTGAVALIEVRRLGVSRRMLSTPTSVRTILVGETLGRFGVAVVQGLIIMAGSLVVFSVDFGDPLGATALLLTFCLVGAGAGILVGATLATDQQAGAMGLLLGLGMAALGGSMVPMEFFPDAMVTAAHVTPHAWGNDAFAELVRRDGSLVDIAPELGVLAAYAAVLLALASWRLRKALTG